MADVVIEGKVLAWGNSYGIRIRKDELEASELHPGEEVVVRIERRERRLDLSGLPTFASGHADTARRHDAVLGEARSSRRLGDEAQDQAEDGNENQEGAA